MNIGSVTLGAVIRATQRFSHSRRGCIHCVVVIAVAFHFFYITSESECRAKIAIAVVATGAMA